MAALDFPASSASPWTAPNGVIYTWNADGYWEAKADPNDFDTDYLKLNATNDPVTGNLALDQDLDVTGTSTFTGLTTHEDGVNVTGGRINMARYDTTSANPIGLSPEITAAFGSGNIQVINNAAIIKAAASGVVSGYHSAIKSDNTSPINEFSHFYAKPASNDAQNNIEKSIGFYADAALSYTTRTKLAYGFYSQLAKVNPNAYNFYAEGIAPNFFAGDTFIGGSTAASTFELWKSTLTEEQLEQYTAGTFAIPANVSLPGDGTFARQWWYDQQSTEDQALIDSGELDYPSHFQAANFTDTFALGENTAINLHKDGSALFQGGNPTISVGNKFDGDDNIACSTLYSGLLRVKRSTGANTQTSVFESYYGAGDIPTSRITAAGLGEFAGGVKVTGGSTGGYFADGLLVGGSTNDAIIGFSNDARIRIRRNDNLTLAANSTKITGIGYISALLSDTHSVNTDDGRACGFITQPTITQDFDNYSCYLARPSTNAIADGNTVEEFVGFRASNGLGLTANITTAIDLVFRSELFCRYTDSPQAKFVITYFKRQGIGCFRTTTSAQRTVFNLDSEFCH